MNDNRDSEKLRELSIENTVYYHYTLWGAHGMGQTILDTILIIYLFISTHICLIFLDMNTFFINFEDFLVVFIQRNFAQSSAD